jgi:hypothetical protein
MFDADLGRATSPVPNLARRGGLVENWWTVLEHAASQFKPPSPVLNLTKKEWTA